MYQKYKSSMCSNSAQKKQQEERSVFDLNIIDEKKIALGDFNEAGKLGKRALRVFISSTFTDTKTERNYLMRVIYPRLRKYCDARGIDFSVVDFRWGNRDQATNDHMTNDICMNEIDKCYRDSVHLAPCFVFLSFNRYGWSPLPRTVEAKEFETILQGVKDQAGKDLINKWYTDDKNAVPPQYVLQPISTYIPEILQARGMY